MSQFHVLHEGRRVGPYDKRTIIGMRMRNTLSGQQLLVDELGRNITVAELMAQGRPAPGRSGAPSSGLYNFSVQFMAPQAAALRDAAYTGEGEVRVQGDVIRIAGSSRGLFGTRRHGRVKMPLATLRSVTLRGRRLELWFEQPSDGKHAARQGAVAFEADGEAALADLVSLLPVPVTDATQAGAADAAAGAPQKPRASPGAHYAALALIASVLVIVLVITALAIHNTYR